MLENRYNELVEILKKANIEYYTLDNPTLTDREYDNYMSELLKIENENPKKVPGLILENDYEKEEWEAGKKRYKMRKNRRKGIL